MAHVFISYAHVDGDFVSLLKIELERAGFEAWIDHELRAGDSWREGIDSAIREAFAMIAVMSPDAFESKYVTYEWAFGYGTGLKIIPVLLQPTDLHPRLEDFQYLDFTHRHGRPWKELMRRLGEVADSRGGALTYRLPLTVPYPIRNAVTGLDSRSKQERRDSVNALIQAKHHPEAVEALARAVEHDFQDVRIQAALALALVTNSSDARAVPGLLEALKDDDWGVRDAAAEALVKIGSAAVPGLLEALKDDDQDVRRAAASALGNIGDPAAVPGLLEALKDGDQDVRRAAAETLVKIGSAAVPGLFEALKDDDWGVRDAAAGALVKFGSAAVPGLLEALKDDDKGVRFAAANALGNIGDPAAVPGLLEVLKDDDWRVRRAVAEALGNIGDPAAVSGLLEALKDDDQDVRRAAAKALVKIGSAAVPGLLEALKDDDWYVRLVAAEALGNIGGPAAVPGLLEALKDDDQAVRLAAAKALEKIGTPAALAAVEEWRNKERSESK